MGRRRSERQLILDRLTRNLSDEQGCIVRLEEIAGMYLDAEEGNPGSYGKYTAMVMELVKAHEAMIEAYTTFIEEGNP